LRKRSRDLEALHHAVYGDPENYWSHGGKPLDYTREIIEMKQFPGTFGSLAVVRRADDTLLGMVNLEPYVASWIRFEEAAPSPFNPVEVELSYVLGREYWGNGYATEAGEALLEYAFRELRLSRLVSTTRSDNTRSQGVLRRLGFRLTRNLHPDHPHEVVAIRDNDLIG
jgi:RimJ/RimL family protein N-acetyltransferase